ncbi:MAG: hypothetical protein ABL921_15370 [Pirellula sp.]
MSVDSIDPWSDAHDREPTGEPSRESIKSLWLGFSGLAVIALSGCWLLNLLPPCLRIVVNWYRFNSGWTSASTRFPALLVFYCETFVHDFLMPAIVLASVVPILYWRGSLSMRFIVSIVIAVTCMNATSEPFRYHNDFGIRSFRIAQIAACWIAIPFLFLCTPIRTRPLRLWVSSGTLLLAFCISMLPMHHAPRSVHVMHWESLYIAGFCLVLLRRNWGSVAFLESTATLGDIDRTSTWTLLELMAIAGVSISILMYWTNRMDRELLTSSVVSAVLGVAIAAQSMYLYRRTLKTQRMILGPWILICLALSCALMPCAAIATLRWYGQAWSTLFSTETICIAIAFGLLAGLFLATYLLVCVSWLRWCGWNASN